MGGVADQAKRKRSLNLASARIMGADFSRADLSDANFRFADLTRAVLRGANMKGTKLEGTILRGADLSDAKNLTWDQLRSAVIDETTTLPDYLTTPERESV